jgi:hypothetical protein
VGWVAHATTLPLSFVMLAGLALAMLAFARVVRE